MKKLLCFLLGIELLVLFGCKTNVSNHEPAKLPPEKEMQDSDYDGINDLIDDDIEPEHNVYKITAKVASYASRVDTTFGMDYRWLTDASNEVYNPNLCKLGILLSISAYGGLDKILVPDNPLKKENGETNFFELIGLKDVEFYNLADNKYKDCPEDVASFYLAHHEIMSKGKAHSVFFIFISGTASNDEWCSNFDIGGNTDFYKKYKPDSKDNWKNPKNHKGFDVTASRIQKYIDAYVDKYTDFAEPVTKELFITGHSRGAALSNLLATKMEGYKTFAYTFACPNTTTDEKAGDCKFIFNIVNTDDIITQVPCSTWNFTRYGITKEFSAAEKIKTVWDEKVYLLNDEDNTKKTVAFANGDAQSWKQYFEAMATDRTQMYTLDKEQYKISLPKNILEKGIKDIVEFENAEGYDTASDDTSFICYTCPGYVTALIPYFLRNVDFENFDVNKFFDPEFLSNITLLLFDDSEISNKYLNLITFTALNNEGVLVSHCPTTYFLLSEIAE